MLRNMLRNCKDEIRVPLLNGGLLRGALCLSVGLLSPPYGTGGGGGGVGVERVVAHNPQPQQNNNGITTDLFNTYGYLVPLQKPTPASCETRLVYIRKPTHCCVG